MPDAPHPKPRQRTPQFNLIIPDDAFLGDVDEWRAAQRPIPSRSAAIIELCRLGIEDEKRRLR